MSYIDRDASYFAVVYFKNQPDGTGRKFYSRDYPNSRSGTRKPELGLKRLQQMITSKFKGKYNTAIIYDAVSGEQKEKYVNDVKQ